MAEMLCAIEAHRQATEHGQTKAQQHLQIGKERRDPTHGSEAFTKERP
jgi:hypothetical protein